MKERQVAAAGEKNGLAVAGLGLTYQGTLLDGQTLAFETTVDATMDRKDLDDCLDAWIGACDRQQAKKELPLVKAGLYANKATLRDQERAKAKLAAEIDARQVIERRNKRPTPEGATAGLQQFDQRIQQLKAAIATSSARIPYLEAIIARKEPPELFPQPDRDLEDAADAA